MEKLIDMHMHTNYSDGDLSPSELIKLAIDKNIKTMAITDHDTLRGIKSVDRNDSFIRDSGIEIVGGVELSAKVPKGRMHILGYGINLDDEVLNRRLLDMRDNSINTVLTIYEQIKKDYNIRFGYEDIVNLVNANHNLGRPDLAKLLIKHGYATSVQDAFDKYLIDAFNKTRQSTKGLQYKECIELIQNSGGIPVLAHPKSLELDKEELESTIKTMINYGLMGIEVYHSSHSAEEMAYYEKLAYDNNLLVSGGSDYHGTSVKPDIDIGTGRNRNLRIRKLSLIDELRNRKKI